MISRPAIYRLVGIIRIDESYDQYQQSWSRDGKKRPQSYANLRFSAACPPKMRKHESGDAPVLPVRRAEVPQRPDRSSLCPAGYRPEIFNVTVCGSPIVRASFSSALDCGTLKSTVPVSDLTCER